MLAATALSSLHWPFTQRQPDAVGTPGFCFPATGPFSITLSAYFDDIRPTYNNSARSTQFLRQDRTLQVIRRDIQQLNIRSFENAEVTFLTNFKQNAEWTISRDPATGKVSCSKSPNPPGPQPANNDCIADVTAVGRGT